MALRGRVGRHIPHMPLPPFACFFGGRIMENQHHAQNMEPTRKSPKYSKNKNYTRGARATFAPPLQERSIARMGADPGTFRSFIKFHPMWVFGPPGNAPGNYTSSLFLPRIYTDKAIKPLYYSISPISKREIKLIGFRWKFGVACI